MKNMKEVIFNLVRPAEDVTWNKAMADCVDFLMQNFDDWDEMLHDDGTVEELIDAIVSFWIDQDELGAEEVSLEALKCAYEDMRLFIHYRLYSSHFYKVKGRDYYKQFSSNDETLEKDKWVIDYGEHTVSWDSSEEELSKLPKSFTDYIGMQQVFRDTTYGDMMKILLDLYTTSCELLGDCMINSDREDE